MINTWILLKKELSYFGICLLNNRNCQILVNNEVKKQGIIKTIRQINKSIKKQKNILLSLWKEIIELLRENQSSSFQPIDEKMIDLFIFSLKDLSKFLLCFEDCDETIYQKCIEDALNRDIILFNKEQIYKLPDYKITIDWIFRTITRALYIKSLLSFAIMGEDKIGQYEVKMAAGIAGPWSRLDIPMQERVFPFGKELENRTKAKQKQRRYRKGLENYGPGDFVSEGFVWRELRNEPFAWSDRNFDDPYPGRNYLRN